MVPKTLIAPAKLELTRLRVDTTLVKFGSHNECVSDRIPLTLGAEKVEQLAKIMYQARHLHPFRLAVFADRFGGLQQVLNLRNLGVG